MYIKDFVLWRYTILVWALDSVMFNTASISGIIYVAYVQFMYDNFASLQIANSKTAHSSER